MNIDSTCDIHFDSYPRGTLSIMTLIQSLDQANSKTEVDSGLTAGERRRAHA